MSEAVHGTCACCASASRDHQSSVVPLRAIAQDTGGKALKSPVKFCDRCDNGKDWPRFRA